jgi:hypothetical protein
MAGRPDALMNGASMNKPQLSLDLLKSTLIGTCKCGGWQWEVEVSDDLRTSEALGVIDAAFQEHLKKCRLADRDDDLQDVLYKSQASGQ